MKNLKDIISEKLIINKSSKTKTKTTDIEDIELNWEIKSQYNALSNKEKETIFNSVKKAQESNTKRRLYHSKTHLYTIMNKWLCSVLLGWNDGITFLQDGILKFQHNPFNINENTLYNIIYKIYKFCKDSNADIIGSDILFLKFYIDKFERKEIVEKCENYFSLYHINI